jgi:hypothetical protein
MVYLVLLLEKAQKQARRGIRQEEVQPGGKLRYV